MQDNNNGFGFQEIEHTEHFFISNTILVYLDEYTKGSPPLGVNDCGIYCFYDEFDNPLYLGQSKNLITRVQQHFRYPSHPMNLIKPLIYKMRFLLTDKEEYRQATLMEHESKFIREINPLFNGTGTRGLYNLRPFIDGSRFNISTDEIKERITLFTGNQHEESKEVREAGAPMCSKEIFSVKESIKLAAKLEDAEKADEIIEGLLQIVAKTRK